MLGGHLHRCTIIRALCFGLRHIHGLFKMVEQPPCVAIGGIDEGLRRRLADSAVGRLTGACDELIQFVVAKRLEHINRGAREQSVVDLKRGILSGRADEGE